MKTGNTRNIRKDIVLFLLILALTLTACAAPTPTPPPTITAGPTVIVTTSTPSPAPTPSPTPDTLLPREAFWVGVQGYSDRVLALSPGQPEVIVTLPINEGQQASDPVASTDGRWLAYIVWNDDGPQRGVALWDLTQQNARLVASALPGYRITQLLFSRGDPATLVMVQVQQDIALEDADWRIEAIPTGDGTPLTLLTRFERPDDPPPDVIAWTADLLLLDAGPQSGIIAYAPASGVARVLVPAGARGMARVSLSPGETALLYLSRSENARQGEPTDLAVLHDLRLRTDTDLLPPERYAVFGAHWAEDGAVLLDLYDRAAAGSQPAQAWAHLDPAEPGLWEVVRAGVGQEALFDYRPWKNGVAYTTLNTGDPAGWGLVIVPDFSTPESVEVLPLTGLEDVSEGAPVLLYVP